MYQPSKPDWLTSLVIAALGAGIITSSAVLLGQNPLMGLTITGLAALIAVGLERSW